MNVCGNLHRRFLCSLLLRLDLKRILPACNKYLTKISINGQYYQNVLFEWWESNIFLLGRNLFWPLRLSLSLLRVVCCHYWKVSDADCLSLVTDRQLVSVSRELVSDRAAASMGNKETFRIHNILCLIPDLIKQTGYIQTFRKEIEISILNVLHSNHKTGCLKKM